jgi:hypothetical protein
MYLKKLGIIEHIFMQLPEEKNARYVRPGITSTFLIIPLFIKPQKNITMSGIIMKVNKDVRYPNLLYYFFGMGNIYIHIFFSNHTYNHV